MHSVCIAIGSAATLGLARLACDICLIIMLVRKHLFSKCYFSYNYECFFDIIEESSLRDPTLSLCSWWRFGGFWAIW